MTARWAYGTEGNGETPGCPGVARWPGPGSNWRPFTFRANADGQARKERITVRVRYRGNASQRRGAHTLSATPAQHQSRHPARSVIGWVLTASAASILLILARPVGLDLKVYREGAQALLQGADLYAPTLGPVGDPGLPFTYPPIAALLFAPLLVVPFPVAYWIMSAATVAVTHLLVCDLAVRWSTLGRRAAHAWVLTPFILVTSPFLDTLTYGQINVLLMGVCYFGLTRAGRGWAFGVAVGLTAAIKLTPLALLLLPLLLWRWRAIMGAGIAFISLQLATLVAFPKLTMAYWGSVIWDPSRVGNVDYIDNLSLRGGGRAAWRANVDLGGCCSGHGCSLGCRHLSQATLGSCSARRVRCGGNAVDLAHQLGASLRLVAVDARSLGRGCPAGGTFWVAVEHPACGIAPGQSQVRPQVVGHARGRARATDHRGGLPALIILVATTAGAVSGGNERAPARSLADQPGAR